MTLGNYSNGNSNGHSNNSTVEINAMSVDPIEEDFDFEQNLALFDKNKFYDEVGHPILNNTACMTPNEPQLNAGRGVIRSLPRARENARNSAVTTAHTVCDPASCGPVRQYPSRQ